METKALYLYNYKIQPKVKHKRSISLLSTLGWSPVTPMQIDLKTGKFQAGLDWEGLYKEKFTPYQIHQQEDFLD